MEAESVICSHVEPEAEPCEICAPKYCSREEENFLAWLAAEDITVPEAYEAVRNYKFDRDRERPVEELQLGLFKKLEGA